VFLRTRVMWRSGETGPRYTSRAKVGIRKRKEKKEEEEEEEEKEDEEEAEREEGLGFAACFGRS